MDKFELKEKLIEIANYLEKAQGKLREKGCDSEETGSRRASALRALNRSADELRVIIYSLY